MDHFDHIGLGWSIDYPPDGDTKCLNT